MFTEANNKIEVKAAECIHTSSHSPPCDDREGSVLLECLLIRIGLDPKLEEALHTVTPSIGQKTTERGNLLKVFHPVILKDSLFLLMDSLS